MVCGSVSVRSTEIESWSDISERRVLVVCWSMREIPVVVVSQWSMEVGPCRKVGVESDRGEREKIEPRPRMGGSDNLIQSPLR